jgi:hypothetical protein
MNIGEKKKHRRKEYTECIDEIKIRKLFWWAPTNYCNTECNCDHELGDADTKHAVLLRRQIRRTFCKRWSESQKTPKPPKTLRGHWWLFLSSLTLYICGGCWTPNILGAKTTEIYYKHATSILQWKNTDFSRCSSDSYPTNRAWVLEGEHQFPFLLRLRFLHRVWHKVQSSLQAVKVAQLHLVRQCRKGMHLLRYASKYFVIYNF